MTVLPDWLQPGGRAALAARGSATARAAVTPTPDTSATARRRLRPFRLDPTKPRADDAPLTPNLRRSLPVTPYYPRDIFLCPETIYHQIGNVVCVLLSTDVVGTGHKQRHTGSDRDILQHMMGAAGQARSAATVVAFAWF